MDELALAQRLIAFDTSNAEGLRRAAEFVGGWLESNDIEARQTQARGLPVTRAEVGPANGEVPTLVLHGHLDVVPGGRDQFEPRIDRDKLLGRGAYDMKGALAVMLMVMHDLRDQEDVRLRLGIVSDEESEEEENRGSDALVSSGFVGDFAITGEPTNLQVGVQANRIATVCTPQLRPVRPPLHQSRSDHGRRRPEQSARQLRHRRRYPLPARPGSRRDPRAGDEPPRHARARDLQARAGGRRGPLPVRGGAVRGRLAPSPRAGDE